LLRCLLIDHWRGALHVASVLLLALSASAAADPMQLSAEEQGWLSTHQEVVRVGVIEIPPLVMRDPQSDAFFGMAIDFMRRYEEQLGLRFQVRVFASWKEALDAARERRVDALLTAVDTPDRRAFLRFPKAYVTLRNVIIARRGEVGRTLDLRDLAGKRVAVLEASAVHERIVKEYPEIKALPLRAERAVLTAVAFHEADFAITELSRAGWWIQQEKLGTLGVVGATSFDYALSLAVRSDWDPLASALDKASMQMTGDEQAAIFQRWAQLEVPADWIGKENQKLLFVLTGGMLLAVAFFVLSNRLLRRTVRQRTAELHAQLKVATAIQAQMSESERRFRELAELASDIFWETNEKLVFVRYYGGGTDPARLARVLGKAWWDLPQPVADRRGAPSKASAGERDALRCRMEARQPVQRVVHCLLDEAGSPRWLLLNGLPEFAPGGDFLGYRGTGQDITERMQQQTVLADALQRVQAVHDGTYSMLGLLSPDGDLLDCNRAALRSIAVGLADVVGLAYWTLPWWRIEEEATRVRDAVASAAQGHFVRHEARIVDATGVVHWIDFSLSPIYDRQGRLVYLVQEGHDITESKRASFALDNLLSSTGEVFGEAFLQRVVEAIAKVLVVKATYIGRLDDDARQVRSVSAWVEGKLAGPSESFESFNYALAGAPCAKVCEFGSCVYPSGVQALFPDASFLRERGADSYIGVPVVGGSGTPIGLLVALHDRPLVDTASARRLMELFAVRIATEFDRLDYEREIGDLNASLERRVRERTTELEQANRELEAFSYSVSHDLRAPLRHISGFADLLEQEAKSQLPPEAQRHLAIIGESAQRMGGMIDDLLTLSRTSRTELRKTFVALRPLVEEVIAEVQRETTGCAGRAVEWRLGDLPEVLADRGLLRLVLVNLLSNALKYARPEVPPVIEIGLVAAQSQGDSAVFCVRDNGLGFDMRYVGKLFGVFQRLHGNQIEGTGVGLANVRRIVERHGGRVWAEAVVQQGARFYFSLPCPAALSQAAPGAGRVAAESARAQ
jgi:PAS domain S-box-containing protein